MVGNETRFLFVFRTMIRSLIIITFLIKIVVLLMWLTNFDMLLEFHGSIPLHSTIKSLLKINAKCSWSFVGRFLHVSILNPYHKSMEHVPGTHLATSLLIENVLQNLPEPSWANSCKFPCGTTIKNNGECYCSSLGQSLYIPKSLQRKHVPGIHG